MVEFRLSAQPETLRLLVQPEALRARLEDQPLVSPHSIALEGVSIWSQAHGTVMAPALLELLLGAQVVAVAALLLAAVDCTGVQACIALAADHLVTVVLLGKLTKGRLAR